MWRQKAGLQLLANLTTPDDFMYTPRIYTFELDQEDEEALMQ